MLYSLLKHFVKYSGTFLVSISLKAICPLTRQTSCLNYSIKKHEDCKYVWVCSISLISKEKLFIKLWWGTLILIKKFILEVMNPQRITPNSALPLLSTECCSLSQPAVLVASPFLQHCFRLQQAAFFCVKKH